MLNRKGFLGPIGDDLPSLIPLLFALVIFFSTFTFTFEVFEDRSRDFEDDLSVLRIARVLKTNGYISSYENFEELCNSLGISNLNFRAGLTNAETARQNYIAEYLGGDEDKYKRLDIFTIKFYETSEGVLECANVEPDEYLTLENSVDRIIITRVYPVVLEDKRIVKPMHLLVIAWK